jgi:LmbE family N-acetylglucosaminyl deacetylase
MNVIAIGAHPDDIEYGCYGTMLKHKREGDRIVFIVLSQGEKSGSREVRKKEAIESAKRVGAKLYLFNYPDTNIPQTHEVIERLEKIIKEFSPQRIYTHSTKDTHQDHRSIAYATLAAARFVPEIFCYESPSLYLNFQPNNFIENKIEALNTFLTQNSKDYMKINAIKGLAQFRGLATSVKYAEAFEAIKILKISGT